MNLENLYNEYKKHTGYTAEYSASDFPRKLRDAFSQYGLDQYMLLITPEKKGAFSKDAAYTFTKEEVQKLGYFLSSATSRYTTTPDKYSKIENLNPFLHVRNRENMGISDLENFTNKCIEDGSKLFDFKTRFTYPKIKILIWFANELKKCIKRLIIASFYMKGFNGNTFSRIISGLNNFVDELYLLEELDDLSELDLLDYDSDENYFYRSIDVLAAADMCDHIYYSRTDNEEDYFPLVSLTDIKSVFMTTGKSYRSSLKETISKLYNNYVNLLSKGYEDVEILEKHKEELGVDLTVQSVETVIFKKFIFFDGKNVFERRLEMEEAIKNTYEMVIDMISSAENKAKEKSSEGAMFDDAIDKLLFKPFIKFHDDDLEFLNKRLEKNSKVLPDKKGKRLEKS